MSPSEGIKLDSKLQLNFKFITFLASQVTIKVDFFTRENGKYYFRRDTHFGRWGAWKEVAC